ncbi:MAG: purine-nucleoside phosphorylase [Desulfosarcinaceae bacterium]|nr:purine-nucleoside phosphorylase [Desulfosarcinaceae bacterium]
MNTTWSDAVASAAEFLRPRLTASTRVGLLTGTGLGDLAGSLAAAREIPYSDIPHFPAATVQSHKGILVSGELAAVPMVVCQGRFHLYEGYSPQAVTFSIRVLQALGVDHLIVTNAAGGLDLDYAAGDLMLIADHINLTGANPLVGPNDANWGVRFPDMIGAYDPRWRQAVADGAAAAGLRLHTGIYAGLRGPSLETPAETRYLRTIGADAVGFSTIMEVITAVHAGMRVLGISTITNINDPDAPQPATLEEIIAVAEGAAPSLEKVVRIAVEALSLPSL